MEIEIIMAKKIYYPALQSDILLFYKRISNIFFSGWIWAISIIVFSWLDFSLGKNIIWVLGVISLIRQITEFYKIKKLEKKGRALLIEKKKNERNRNIGYMFLFFTFTLMFNFADTLPFIFGFLAFYFLMKYFFYIPSTIFIANDYELIIKRKRKCKVFDFSYPNRLRFVYNMISFEHPISGKETWKDINMDRAKMNEIRLFLSSNYGREMVLNPTTGLPYTI